MKKINHLLRDLGFKVSKIRYKNGEKIITTDYGEYVVKESLNNDVYDYLDSRGFSNYSHLLRNNENYNIYQYEEDHVRTNDKAIDLVYLLSLLHIKTTTYQEVDLDKVKEFYEKTMDEIEYLNTYYHKLQDYVEEKVYMSPAEYLFIRNASLIYEMLYFSKDYLEKWYDMKTKAKRERVVLVNNNLSLSNFVESDEDKFLNWDKARKDWVSYDFYDFYIHNYLELEMKSLYEIYQSKYKYTLDEEVLLYTLLCKLWKVDLKKSNYSNCVKISNLVVYLRKTKEFISKDYKENQKANEEEF